MKTSFKLFLCAFLMISLSISCSSDDPEPQEEQEMEEEETLSGEYTGTWDSTTPTVTFSGFPITAKFVVSSSNPNRINAEFFATDSYVSCCSTNPNDGTMVINLDGSTITSFTFNDTIVDCEGSFTGSGIIDATGTFVIDFTGDDCDGAHVGQLKFKKQ